MCQSLTDRQDHPDEVEWVELCSGGGAIRQGALAPRPVGTSIGGPSAVMQSGVRSSSPKDEIWSLHWPQLDKREEQWRSNNGHNYNATDTASALPIWRYRPVAAGKRRLPKPGAEGLE